MGLFSKVNKSEILNKSNIAFGVFKVILDDEGEPCDFEFTYVNEAMAKLEETSETKLMGTKFSALHKNAAKSWAKMLYPAAYQNKHVERKNYIESLNFLAQLYAFPLDKGICGVFLKNFTSEINNVIKSITGKDVCVFYYDLDRDVIIADAGMVERFGGKNRYDGIINSFALELVDEAYVDVLRTEMAEFPENNRLLETTLKLKSGKLIHFALSADENYREERLALGYIEDVSNVASLAREAELDSLTGLFHEPAARERIDAAILECVENKRIDAMLLIDLDDFMNVNSAKGYEFGDEILKECAEEIRNNFKGKDILSHPGGDEFIVYVSDLSDKRSALLISRTLNRLLTKEISGKDIETIKVTASIGIAYAGDNGMNYDQMYAKAEEALKEAKSNGKNGYSLA